jgi:hypothetical protein
MGGPAVAEQKQRTDDERELLRALVSGPAVGVPQHADAATRETFTERRMAQREAYGQFIADGPIYWPGTAILVFTEGQAVPIEHVEKWELEEAGMVHRVASAKLARAGRRFSAEDGGQLTGGDGSADVAVEPQPTMTPPAPSGEEAAKADVGGEPKSPRRSSSTKSGS